MVYGLYPHRAAVLHGVHERTHYRWWTKGLDDVDEDGEPTTLQGEYRLAIKVAEAMCQKDWVAELRAAKAGSWQKWSALLERRFRDEWSQGRDRKVTVDGEEAKSQQTIMVVTKDAMDAI